jgi:ABC-2 type transport system ATP-binding protein
MCFLRLTDLRKSFGAIVAVDRLSLDIHEGEIFGLLGPNGAGKSTTIAMIVGLLRPDSGSVEMEGSGSTLTPAARARIGVAPQSLALYDELSARENLDFFGRLYEMPGPARRARIDALLEFVGLADRARSRVRTYSGGMKRRLNLAVALLHDPPLLLLDEPTVGVDPQSRNNLFEIIESLRARGRTILYTTHYMEEAQRLCDRVGVIDHGRLLAVDSVEGLIRAHGGRSLVVVERAGQEDERISTDDPMTQLRRAFESEAPTGVRVERPNLEAVFLNLTGRTLRD